MISLSSDEFERNYSFLSRSENGEGSSRQELNRAAPPACCVSMTLACSLEMAGDPATRVHTTEKIHSNQAGGGFAIGLIGLDAEAEAPQRSREEAPVAQNYPVSNAFAATTIMLQPRLT